jgi:hypothetical protein
MVFRYVHASGKEVKLVTRWLMPIHEVVIQHLALNQIRAE